MSGPKYTFNDNFPHISPKPPGSKTGSFVSKRTDTATTTNVGGTTTNISRPTSNSNKSVSKGITNGVSSGSSRGGSGGQSKGSVLVCLCNGRGHSAGTVGLAALDLRTNRLFVRQLEDTPNYYTTCIVLTSLDPIEITVPRTTLDAKPEGQLIKQLRLFFPEVQLTGIERRWYNDCKGVKTLRRVNMFPDSVSRIDIELRNKYYALASVNALMKYAEMVQKSATPGPNSLRIDILPPVEGVCQLDAVTVRELELVASLDVAGDAHKYTLFDVMNYTATGSGQRALKLRLLQPLQDVAQIEERLDCIAELIGRPALAQDLHHLLGRTIDLERLISNFMKEGLGGGDQAAAIANRLQCLLCLKHNLDIVQSFQKVLTPYIEQTGPVSDGSEEKRKSYINVLHNFMSDQRFQQILKTLNTYLVPDIFLSRGVLDSLSVRIGCIRTGISDTLDEYRKLYAQTVEEVNNIRSRVAEQYQLSRLQLIFSAVRGFHFSLPSSSHSAATLPPEFIKRTYGRSNYHFTTESLLRANERLDLVVTEIYNSSIVVLQPVIDEIRPHFESLFKLAEMWTELDVTCSLAIVANVSDGFVRPRFSENITAIEEGRHPVLARHWSSENPDVFHPNPLWLTSKENMIVLTGPNNAGKSVYLKQLALLQILAQIGSYVPAKWAVFRPAGKIFSRTGCGDDLVSNCSSYKLEVVRVSQVLDSVEEDSLVVMDELGRGTSEEDGAALCFSVASYLRKFKAFVVFSTHFELVTHLEKFYPNVSNYHIHAEIENGQLIYKHNLCEGVTPLASYGVQTARQNGMLDTICTEAKKVAEIIWLNSKPLKELDEAHCTLALRRQASALRKKMIKFTRANFKKLTSEQAKELAEGVKSLQVNKQQFMNQLSTHQNQHAAIELEMKTRGGKDDSSIILQNSITGPPISASPFLGTGSTLQTKT